MTFCLISIVEGKTVYSIKILLKSNSLVITFFFFWAPNAHLGAMVYWYSTQPKTLNKIWMQKEIQISFDRKIKIYFFVKALSTYNIYVEMFSFTFLYIQSTYSRSIKDFPKKKSLNNRLLNIFPNPFQSSLSALEIL